MKGMCIKMLMFNEGMYVHIVCVYRRYVFYLGMYKRYLFKWRKCFRNVCIYRMYVCMRVMNLIKVCLDKRYVYKKVYVLWRYVYTDGMCI